MNYNDGKWHGWNGEADLPHGVHPYTTVEVRYDFSKEVGLADQFRWIGSNTGDIFAFRVIKEHKEPREFWVCYGNSFRSIDEAKKYYGFSGEIINVREVLE